MPESMLSQLNNKISLSEADTFLEQMIARSFYSAVNNISGYCLISSARAKARPRRLSERLDNPPFVKM